MIPTSQNKLILVWSTVLANDGMNIGLTILKQHAVFSGICSFLSIGETTPSPSCANLTSRKSCSH